MARERGVFEFGTSRESCGKEEVILLRELREGPFGWRSEKEKERKIPT